MPLKMKRKETGSDSMKIERISENQIRCTLSNFDLSVRNLNLTELAYGSEKARNLFREMIQRASNEVGFEAEDIPLMVEAIPLANESVMLIITKIEDPEELDTRFSKFSPTDDEEDTSSWGSLATELLEGAEGLLNLLNDASLDKTLSLEKTEEGHKKQAPASDTPALRIYQFETLDRVCEAAQGTGTLFQGDSALYKHPVNGQYFLILKNQNGDDLSFSRTCNILSEFGSRVKSDPAAEAYCAEHYEPIVKKNALAALGSI